MAQVEVFVHNKIHLELEMVLGIRTHLVHNK